MAVTFSVPRKRPAAPQATNGHVPHRNGLSFEGTNHTTALLIHGLTGAPSEMKFLATFFHRQGYSVLCPRLANHGTPMETLQKTTWQDCYESVREAFAKIDAQRQTEHLFVAGLSMGALLALLLVEEFPDRIAGVSCLSPTLFYDGWNVPRSRYWLPILYRTPLLRDMLYFKEEPPYGIKDEALRKRVHAFYRDAKLHDADGVAQYGYPYIPVSLLYQLHLLVKHLSKKLPRITAPVQLLQARHDDMTSVKNSQFIYDRIGSTRKEIVFLEDSYHVITVDRERDLVAQNVGEFFGRLRSQRYGTPTHGNGAKH